MKEIKLTKGKVALVDDQDYEMINRSTWCVMAAGNNYYARTTTREPKTVLMHYLLLPRTPGFETDHIDGNGLNNQRENLRYSTDSQNQMNQKPQLGTSSKYKGVSWNKRRRKWQAQIKLNYRGIYLGYFKEEKDAALTYNLAALEYFGEFAHLNTINSPVDREQLMKKLIELEKGGMI